MNQKSKNICVQEVSFLINKLQSNIKLWIAILISIQCQSFNFKYILYIDSTTVNLNVLAE